MHDLFFRKATLDDIPLLVEAIIEAEKSGTDKLSYSTVFGLTENEASKYIADMLFEEVDDCELALSSFLIAEKDKEYVGAVSAWIEGHNGIPSSILKGNLLHFILPEECIQRAKSINSLISEIIIEYIPNSIQIGVGYVSKDFRGHRYLSVFNDEIINRLSKDNPEIKEVYVQMFGCNAPAININTKANFKEVLVKESSNKEILNYLPSNKKILMKKQL